MDQSPEFNYKHVHHVDCISDYVLDYWEKGNIACKVFAYPQYTMVKGKKKIVQEQTVDEPAIVKSSTTINKSSDNKALPPT